MRSGEQPNTLLTTHAHQQFSSAGGLGAISGSFKHNPVGTMRHERNSNSLVARQPLLLGSNSMTGVLAQCASNCDITPISDIMRPGTSMVPSNSHLPLCSQPSKSGNASGKLSSHKKTLTSTNIEQSVYLAHGPNQPMFDNWQIKQQ